MQDQDRNDDTPELAATRRWLERAVIGLNLCPFAKAVYVKQQVRFVLSDAELEDDLLEELAEELLRLRDTPAEEIDTTLLVHPRVLTDFLEYNDFLDRVDAQRIGIARDRDHDGAVIGFELGRIEAHCTAAIDDGQCLAAHRGYACDEIGRARHRSAPCRACRPDRQARASLPPSPRRRTARRGP